MRILRQRVRSRGQPLGGAAATRSGATLQMARTIRARRGAASRDSSARTTAVGASQPEVGDTVQAYLSGLKAGAAALALKALFYLSAPPPAEVKNHIDASMALCLSR